MSLDEAISRYIAALAEVESARKELVEELRKIGISGRTTQVFLKNLEDNVRRGGIPQQAPDKKSKAKSTNESKHTEEPKQDGGVGAPKEPNDGHKVAKPVEKPRTRRRTSVLTVPVGEFVWDPNKKEYIYNLTGRTKKGKYLPLFRFRQTVLAFHDNDQYGVMVPGQAGRSKIKEALAILQVRTLMGEIETGEVSSSEYEVFGNFIQGVLPRMRPLARSVFEELLKTVKEKSEG